MLSLVWFKRDLRVADHPALSAAAARGAVLPVYIVEPERWAQPDASARQWEFVSDSLGDLRRDLAAAGQPLLIRVGDAVTVLARLQALTGFSAIYAHEETGSGWTLTRDRRVAEWARGQGIEWIELPQTGVRRRSQGMGERAAPCERFMAQPLLPVPALAPVADGSGAIPSARSLRLVDDRCTFRQTGGRDQGLRLLETFLDQRGQNYRHAPSLPSHAERACSRLSPFLAHGALSLREVAQASTAAKARWRGQAGWGPSLRSFGTRLAGREHFIQMLEDEPSLEHRALHPAMEGLRPATDAARLAAWQRGETGLPFVDACMRYLHATGWLTFRMRALLVSLAAGHLWLDWRATGPFLARLFTDYEPGIHWCQMQIHAGTTGTHAIRLADPVRLGLEQDPTGSFIRRWLPELAPVPDAFVHTPWRWPAARTLLGRRYPEPVVDPASAARIARNRLLARRHAAGLEKGARSAPVVPKRDEGQLTLDL